MCVMHSFVCIDPSTLQVRVWTLPSVLPWPPTQSTFWVLFATFFLHRPKHASSAYVNPTVRLTMTTNAKHLLGIVCNFFRESGPLQWVNCLASMRKEVKHPSARMMCERQWIIWNLSSPNITSFWDILFQNKEISPTVLPVRISFFLKWCLL